MNKIIELAPLSDYFVVVIKDKITGELQGSFTLNESAAEILKLLIEGKNLATIAQKLADMYEVPVEIITKDINKLTTILKEKGLVF